jgi:hypothetical protein
MLTVLRKPDGHDVLRVPSEVDAFMSGSAGVPKEPNKTVIISHNDQLTVLGVVHRVDEGSILNIFGEDSVN